MAIKVFGTVAVDLANVVMVSQQTSDSQGNHSSHMVLGKRGQLDDICVMEISETSAIALLKALKEKESK